MAKCISFLFTSQSHTEKAMATHSSTLAWKIPRTEELVGCSPWGLKESDTTEQLPFHFSLSLFISFIGEGNGNPLQCSCLENPREGGAWWAAVYGVAQSRTRLNQLSSSSIYSKIVLISVSDIQRQNQNVPTFVSISGLIK